MKITNTMCSNKEIGPNKILTYKKHGDIELKIHIFNPKAHGENNKYPAIVFFFGGGWVMGTPKQFYQHAYTFSKLGFVALSADYRVMRKHKTTPFESVKDGKSVIRWIRKYAKELQIDPNKLVAVGESSGGHVAVCSGVIEGHDEDDEDLNISSLPNAMILYNPVVDTTENGYGLRKVGMSHKTEISPCHHVHEGIPSTLIFHRIEDSTIPYENVERFTKLMTVAGNSCTLIPLPGSKHGFFNDPLTHTNNVDYEFNITLKHSIDFMKKLGYLQNNKRNSELKLL